MSPSGFRAHYKHPRPEEQHGPSPSRYCIDVQLQETDGHSKLHFKLQSTRREKLDIHFLLDDDFLNFSPFSHTIFARFQFHRHMTENLNPKHSLTDIFYLNLETSNMREDGRRVIVHFTSNF